MRGLVNVDNIPKQVYPSTSSQAPAGIPRLWKSTPILPTRYLSYDNSPLLLGNPA